MGEKSPIDIITLTTFNIDTIMVTIIMQNKNTGEYNYTSGETRESAKAYFNKWYARNWKIATAIEGESVEL